MHEPLMANGQLQDVVFECGMSATIKSKDTAEIVEIVPPKYPVFGGFDSVKDRPQSNKGGFFALKPI